MQELEQLAMSVEHGVNQEEIKSWLTKAQLAWNHQYHLLSLVCMEITMLEITMQQQLGTTELRI